MSRTTSASILFIFICCSFSFSAEKKIVVISSGETHAMLNACDCPTEPGGGFAKRATMITRLRDSNNVLLVDVGGFAGGGIYDSYTEGRYNDSLRTMAAIRAIGYMKYDAVCIGDDDLQYGADWLARQAFYSTVPLVSANCVRANGRPFASPFVIVKRGKYSFGIIGVMSLESLFPLDSSVVIKPPIPMLKAVWNNLKASSDFQIILAHVGEAESRTLLDTFPECALVVNGHRKTTPEEFVTGKGQVMMQFGFQGKSLSFAEIVTDSKGPTIGKTGRITIGPGIPGDPEVSRLVALPVTGSASMAQSVFDLYIMSQCQFGCTALREFTSFVSSFPFVQWQVWFIGSSFIDSTVSSLHGQSEIDDEQLWLSVQALYPEMWLQFLQKRASSSKPPTEAVVREMGLDYSRIKLWAGKKGMNELRRHYERSMRMGINASPTLLINNAAFQQEITGFRLSKIACSQAAKKFAFCDSLPECGSDADCRKPGKIGSCVAKKGKKAVCEFKDAPRFTLTVVSPDSGLFHPEYGVIASVQDDFPGVVVDSVKAGTARGKTLLKEYEPRFLPLFLFDTAILNTPKYSSLSAGLVAQKAKLVFKEGMVKPSYFFKRKLLPGTIELYVDPLFPGSLDAIRIALQAQGGKLKVKIMPDLFEKPDTAGLSAEATMRQEEALRWLVLQKNYPSRYTGYLTRFCARAQKNMSYWFTDCKKLGIDVDEFVKKVQEEGSTLIPYWKELEPLGMKEPIEALIANREVVAVKNPKELTEILLKIKQ
jgi:hypothetical protein